MKHFQSNQSYLTKLKKKNAILHWMRQRVRIHALSVLKKGDKILELNAGTGLDAFFFAKMGFKVHATDISSGMIEILQQKIKNNGQEGNIKAEQLSYTNLKVLPDACCDFVFSNFGGLNCIPDLNPVIQEFKRILKPGGRFTIVVMPPVCPWEILSILKGNTKLAIRRFKKDGTASEVEGISFTSWYFQPSKLIKFASPEFKLIKWEGLGTLVPPPHHLNFPRWFPGLFRFMKKIDERFSGTRIFRSWADHFILSMEFQPSHIKQSHIAS